MTRILKVKIIGAKDKLNEFENELNEFLRTIDNGDLIDIKFVQQGNYNNYTAMVIYKK